MLANSLNKVITSSASSLLVTLSSSLYFCKVLFKASKYLSSTLGSFCNSTNLFFNILAIGKTTSGLVFNVFFLKSTTIYIAFVGIALSFIAMLIILNIKKIKNYKKLSLFVIIVLIPGLIIPFTLALIPNINQNILLVLQVAKETSQDHK